MDTKIRKQAAMLGGRIGFVFLIASGLMVFAAYFVLSQNFQSLLIDYSVKLVENMVDQGVTTIEYELTSSKNEVTVLAQNFTISDDKLQIPASYMKADVKRVIYTNNTSISTDNKQHDIKKRKDIVDAFNGETSVYGPYFNNYNEYILSYTTPVYKNGDIAGVLTIDKDAYKLSELIKDIRFINSGESYIIDSEGTDIAVSNMEHIEWVNEKYNAQKLLESEYTEETKSVLELEKKGLAGEKGVGTYEWEGGLCYVVYAPISSVNWVLLGGLRQQEIKTMTQSVLFDSLTNGPTLGIIIFIFLALASLILYWIISSMRKSAAINERLNIMANFDALTGALNRNSYHGRIDEFMKNKCPFACIYIDVNGLHEINNHLGHQAGDNMLIAVANAFQTVFTRKDVYRIGGDEFVVLCADNEMNFITENIEKVRHDLKQKNYEVSIGIAYRNKIDDVEHIINIAEERMKSDKQKFYKNNGKERQMRELDLKLERLVTEKQDADAFLSVLAPEFKGVYFVDIGKDTMRHLNIPSYFEEILNETNEIFTQALSLYSKRFIKPEYHESFLKFCNYHNIEENLYNETTLEFTYQKIDDSWMKVRILKFKTYTAQYRETLWIFSSIETNSSITS